MSSENTLRENVAKLLAEKILADFTRVDGVAELQRFYQESKHILLCTCHLLKNVARPEDQELAQKQMQDAIKLIKQIDALLEVRVQS